MTQIINTVSPESTGLTILTEENYERLSMMLANSDVENHTMAQLILIQVDIQKSIYWIWKLSRNYSYRMVNLRTKAGRRFRDDANLFNLSNRDETSFGSYLIQKDWMTPEIFILLKKKIVSEIERCSNSKFFNYTIELKSEYKYLDITDKSQQLHE